MLLCLACTACTSRVRAIGIATGKAISLCKLSVNRDAYDGKRIELRTFLVTDYHERSLLVDKRCHHTAAKLYLDEDASGKMNDSLRKFELFGMNDTVNGHGTGAYKLDLSGTVRVIKDAKVKLEIHADHIWSFSRMPCDAFFSKSTCSLRVEPATEH